MRSRMVEAGPGGPKVRVDPGLDEDGQDEQRGQQQPGKDPGQEQAADGFLGEDGVDHEARAGRDEDAQGAARGDGAGGQPRVVAVGAHLRQGHLAHGHGGCHGRTGERGESGASGDGGGRQSAAPVTEPGVGRGIEVPAHAGNRGEVSHEHEQRDHDKFVVGGDDEGLAAHQRQSRPPAVEGAEPQHPHEHHGNAHGHPESEQQEQPRQSQKTRGGGTHSAFSWGVWGAWTMPTTAWISSTPANSNQPKLIRNMNG